MQNYQNISCNIEKKIATVTIERPDQLNALNKNTIAELGKCITNCQDDAGVGVIILTGSGNKAFVAGADIKEFAHFNVENGQKLSAEGQRQLFDVVADCTTPVIAAINGFALGGGLELAMSAHMRIASENAKMGLPEVSLGVIPGYGGTQRLPQLVGKGKAMEMIFTAGMLSAQEALEWGLVNAVCKQEMLMEKAHQIANTILKNSSNAIAQAIKAINAGFDTEKNGYQAEIKAFGDCFGTPHFKEGTTAFLEKRKANFL